MFLECIDMFFGIDNGKGLFALKKPPVFNQGLLKGYL
jgi:hypothetical protein